MATKIVTKNSSTASAVPTASDLVQGELAVNVADKRLFTEDNAGAIVELGTNPSGNVTFQDNGKAIFGAGSDLQIYHNATSNIIDSSAATLAIQAPQFVVQDATGAKNMVWVPQNGGAYEVQLSHDGSTKLTTTSTGIDVTGTATMDGGSISGNLLVGGTSAFGADTITLGTGGFAGIRNTSGSCLELRRDSTDGSILDFQKDGTTVGSIGTASGDLHIDGAASHSGVRFQAGSLLPRLNGADTDNTIDLGYDDGTATHRWKDLYLSGAANVGGLDATLSTNARGSFSSGIGEVGSGNFALQVTNSAGSALKPLGFRAEDIRFATGSSERMRIDSSGNLLVGTTSTIPFTFSSGSGAGITSGGTIMAGATAEAGLFNRVGSDGAIIQLYKAGGIVGSIGSNSGYMVIGSPVGTDAHLLIGNGLIHPATSTGGAKDNAIDIGGSSNRFKDLYLSGAVNLTNSTTNAFTQAGSNMFQLGTNSADPTVFYTSGAERMRIDASGNLLVGTTTAGDGVSYGTYGVTTIKGEYGAMVKSTGGAGYEVLSLWNTTASGTIYQVIFRDGASGAARGTITTNGSVTAYNTSSDYRLKENIADADDAGSKVDAIQVRKFDWKADGSHQDYGMIAQELQTVAPEAVSGDADSEEMMGVDYSKLVPMLVKEIQSLRNRVAQLEE